MSELLNTVAVFAAPRVYARMPEPAALRAALLDTIDRYVATMNTFDRQNGGMEQFFHLAAAAQELRSTVSQGSPDQALSGQIIELARSCLSVFAIPEPEEGWDAFEGWSEP